MVKPWVGKGGGEGEREREREREREKRMQHATCNMPRAQYFTLILNNIYVFSSLLSHVIKDYLL